MRSPVVSFHTAVGDKDYVVGIFMGLRDRNLR